MRLIILIFLADAILGLIQESVLHQSRQDPTRNNLMDIYYKNEKFGLGVFIYRSYVVTLASIAVLNSSRLKVVSLATNDEYQVVGKEIHDHYFASTFNKQYNVAVLKLDSRPNHSHKFVTLDLDDFASYAYFNGTFSGWSWTEGESSRQVYITTKLIIENTDTCRNHFKGRFYSSVELCASNDHRNRILNLATPGSPLFYHLPNESVLLGLLSWSYEDDSRNLPVVFTKISAVNQWIMSTTRLMSKSKNIDISEDETPESNTLPAKLI